jgi:hypothetical protein
METRRIRRLERRRAHRAITLAVTAGLIGAGVGTTLPQSTSASVALFALAACCLATVAWHADSLAPLHGLHRVVRLPLSASIGATLESFGSRLAGSGRGALARWRPDPAPLPVDGAEDLLTAPDLDPLGQPGASR